mmetsp:Transcript_4062/g.7120  ORF Transcript_4062/g.7120 Transcript_4062/m.7120 type:complete len:690 (-) Transcript_4062:642-2711(-)|eukprot:CAMPEP_0182442186 /NCGR_PEP_ID=MMETSP1172-20130603/1126_1 /TAXON_ID=708627 /ORGANISM="Timspurckia oligopyrenoides, Strain CCMP3278" /LENGTH=689 /DNA_ID=CAMNT_0024636911 /DNA_START=73 /DNA_END=2142 /DNA_ORIENTATION=-
MSTKFTSDDVRRFTQSENLDVSDESVRIRKANTNSRFGFLRQRFGSSIDTHNSIQPISMTHNPNDSELQKNTLADRAADVLLLGKFEGLHGNRRLLRWPVLFAIGCWMLILFTLYIYIRMSVAIYEFITFLLSGKKRRLLVELHDSSSYSEWASVACTLDDYEGYSRWKASDESPYYDADAIALFISKLEHAISTDDVHSICRILRTIYNSNLSGLGIDNAGLYSETYYGSKVLIEHMISAVIEATLYVQDCELLSDESKLMFLKQAQKAYGSTALCLSSGGTMGYYHFGVVKCLLEEDLLPNVISGSSAGALVAAIVSTRTDAELKELLSPELHKMLTPCDESWPRLFFRYLSTGCLFDETRFAEKCRAAVLGDLTFQEAFARSGRTLSVTVTSTLKYGAPVLLNHITAPNVVIWSACLASSAMPGLLNPVQLYQKLPGSSRLIPFRDFGMAFSDGVIKNDIPAEQLSQILNVNFFVVSQMNPHVVPFLFSSKGSSGSPNLSRRGRGSGMRGGFIQSTLEAVLRLEMKKWLFLIEEMDLLPQIYGVDFSRFLLQTFTGHVTITANRGLYLLGDYMRLLSDPSYNQMEHYLTAGSRFTWPNVCRIRNHYILERILRECESEIQEGMEKRKRQKRSKDNNSVLHQKDTKHNGKHIEKSGIHPDENDNDAPKRLMSAPPSVLRSKLSNFFS